jgi:tripartite ATP-independent transporter DctP family solute receptor
MSHQNARQSSDDMPIQLLKASVKQHLSSLLLALTAALPSLALAQTELRAWNIHPDGYPVSQAMESFAQNVERLTGGRYKVKVHSNGVLGDQPKAVQMLKQGDIDLAEFSLGPLAEAAPGTKVLTLPFLFRDAEHMFRQLDGKLGDQFATKLKTAGYVVLGWYDGGARHVYCANKQIRQAGDFQGLRIRVQQSETAMEMVKLLGGTPVVLPYKEVQEALRSGRIDCAENNLPSYESAGHMAVAKHMYLSSHTVSPEALVMSTAAWERMSDSDRNHFMTAGKQSAQTMRQLWKARVEQARINAAKQGTEFAVMRDYGPMVAKMRSLHDKYFQDPVTRQELFTILSQ